MHRPRRHPGRVLGTTHPLHIPIPSGRLPGERVPERSGRLELACPGLIRRFLRCACSSQLLPTPKRGLELAASSSPASFLLTSFLLKSLRRVTHGWDGCSLSLQATRVSAQGGMVGECPLPTRDGHQVVTHISISNPAGGKKM